MHTQDPLWERACSRWRFLHRLIIQPYAGATPPRTCPVPLGPAHQCALRGVGGAGQLRQGAWVAGVRLQGSQQEGQQWIIRGGQVAADVGGLRLARWIAAQRFQQGAVPRAQGQRTGYGRQRVAQFGGQVTLARVHAAREQARAGLCRSCRRLRSFDLSLETQVSGERSQPRCTRQLLQSFYRVSTEPGGSRRLLLIKP